MSPARVDEQSEQERQLQALAKGFDALLLTAQRLSSKEQVLQRRLKYAHDEVHSPAFSPPSPAVSNDERI